MEAPSSRGIAVDINDLEIGQVVRGWDVGIKPETRKYQVQACVDCGARRFVQHVGSDTLSGGLYRGPRRCRACHHSNLKRDKIGKARGG